MPQIKLVLVFTPPGKRDRFASLIEEISDEIVVHDIETRLKNRLGLANTKQVIESNSREGLINEWETTIDNIIQNIRSESANHSKVHVLVGHSIYFNSSTQEIFPIFNPTHLKIKIGDDFEITHVILVIDDVFDSFIALSPQGELYSTKSCYDFLQKYARSRQVSLPTLENQPKPYTSWTYYCINQLLEWRSQEIILSQDIANQFKSKFMLWALKQDPEVLVKWILDKNNKIFYISHPISQHRQNEIENDNWPSGVDEINTVQVKTKTNSLFTVIPTAIDEYRFEKNNEDYTCKLHTRWPVPNFVEEKLRPSHLINDYQQTEVLRPYSFRFVGGEIERADSANVGDLQEFLNGSLTSLEMAIVRQLSNRDHLLVWLTDGIIVIDPYSKDDDKIHGGVGMELQNLYNVNSTLARNTENPKYKKLCAIIPKNVLEHIIESGNFKTGAISKLRELVADDLQGVSRAVIDSAIDNNGNFTITPGELGSSINEADQETIRGNLSNYQKNAVISQILSTTLQIDPDAVQYTMILVVESVDNGLLNEEKIQKIKNFLIEGQDVQWQNEIYEIAKSKNVIIPHND